MWKYLFLEADGGMQWQEVREKFSNEWVVFEAINAYSKDGFCCMDEVKVIDRYDDSLKAMISRTE